MCLIRHICKMGNSHAVYHPYIARLAIMAETVIEHSRKVSSLTGIRLDTRDYNMIMLAAISSITRAILGYNHTERNLIYAYSLPVMTIEQAWSQMLERPLNTWHVRSPDANIMYGLLTITLYKPSIIRDHYLISMWSIFEDHTLRDEAYAYITRYNGWDVLMGRPINIECIPAAINDIISSYDISPYKEALCRILSGSRNIPSSINEIRTNQTS